MEKIKKKFKILYEIKKTGEGYIIKPNLSNDSFFYLNILLTSKSTDLGYFDSFLEPLLTTTTTTSEEPITTETGDTGEE